MDINFVIHRVHISEKKVEVRRYFDLSLTELLRVSNDDIEEMYHLLITSGELALPTERND